MVKLLTMLIQSQVKTQIMTQIDFKDNKLPEILLLMVRLTETFMMKLQQIASITTIKNKHQKDIKEKK